ncbi:MAG: transporter [Alphaproteobacteria bacterium]|nr:transporter [Alphaproteobacteria bacterium]MBU0803725.1 transporter [Alphaproteobacteria bacterium]MBU0872978.1 transporter [Alphaproteobacteria bacterium]MBU1402652.1 transporter [Alphaproteobacteria bacterium]MBU1593294.1 transporter [Alphaproteobacteria bacterium]
MPSFEQVQQYLTGAARMMLGKADGLRMLDFSADGFWNSFFAMVVALPALMIGWVGLANDLEQMPDAIGSRFSILLRIAAIDFASWTGPLVLLALVITRTPIADRFARIVVAGNWGSAVIVWFMLPAPLLRLVYPAAESAASLLSLVLFAVSLLLTWRLTNLAVGKGPAIATAVFVGMFVSSIAILILLQSALGLASAA